jgi:hypothetical protein
MKKISKLTLTGQPIDDLLVENIATMRAGSKPCSMAGS